MYNNILTYICFITICGLLVTDMWLSTNILLQIVCIVLALLVVVLVTYIAYKLHKGTYLSTEQQSNLHSYLSENITLRNELNHIKNKQQKNKISISELQTLVLINTRLTAQNSNLKTHLQTLTEQLQNAKNQGKTVVVSLPTNEQNQTQTNLKKQKSA